MRFHNEIEENDLVWLKQNGIYYLGRISSNSKWKFCTEATDIDACSQIDDVQFVTVGDESSVAGVIATSFIRNMTLQHIWLDGAKEFRCYTFDKLNNSEFYKDEYKLDFTRDVFFNLISPDDCEDLLVSFLFSKYNYMLIPSTAKKGTELYEFVMKDIKNGSNIYAQVKKGDTPLDGNDYKKLINNGEKIYLLSTRGIVSNHNDRDIVKVDPELLFNFAIDKNNEKFLTLNIIMWKNMLYAKSEEGAD